MGYQAFSDASGNVFTSLLKSVVDSNPIYSHVRVYYLHAIQCIVDEDKTSIINHCRPIVHNQIASTNADVIVAMGATAVKSLGIQGSMDSIRGREIPVTVAGKKYICIPTYSAGALMRKEKSGLTRTFTSDLRRGLNLAIPGQRILTPMKELIKDFRIGYSVKEALAILDEIKETWKEKVIPKLAVDTETTGLETWRKGFRMIAMSFTWGKGKSASFLCDHRALKGDFQDLIEPIREVLAGPNPKTFHNYKYDYKVLCEHHDFKINKVVWDSQAGEYLLDENKVGHYGLKNITRNRVPEFADYEKILQGSFTKKSTIDLLDGRMSKMKTFLLKLKDELTDSSEYLAESKAKSATLRIPPVGGRKSFKKGAAYVDCKDFFTDEMTYNTWTDLQKDIKETTSELKVLRTTKQRCTALTKAWREKKKLSIAKAKSATFEDLPVKEMLLYAAIDTECTFRITLQQIKEMMKEDQDLNYAMQEIMIPGAEVLGRMEHEGIRVDQDYLTEVEEIFAKIVLETEREIFQAVGKTFNINSTQQLQDILVFDLGIKLTKKTAKSGAYALGDDVMKELEDLHPVIPLVMKYRSAARAKNTFLKNIRSFSAEDGRIHANYNSTVTATGRLSSSSINMQNIPYMMLGVNIKKLFIPDNDDEEFCDADYSGAEIRVLTAYAHDEELISSLNKGLNIHSFVASEVFGVDYDEIQGRGKIKKTDPERWAFLDNLRQVAKKMVFLTIYGGGAQALQNDLNKTDKSITLEMCETYIRDFLGRFPAIEDYMRSIKMHINRHGFVKTHFGRRRRFPLAGIDWKMKNASHREGINAPIQGTSSDLVVDRLIELNRHRDEIGLKLRVTVHDSFGFSYPKKNRDLVRPFLDKYAEEGVAEKFDWLPVPFIYEAGYGVSYGECTGVIKE